MRNTKPAKLYLTVVPCPKRLAAFLRKQILAAHSLMKSPLQWLSIGVVDDDMMSRLHKRYLGIESPTDVLTFELERDDNNGVTTGEIVLCIDEARRQCEPPDALKNELLLYAVHGMLHLKGMDDKTRAGFKAMHQAEDDILTALGVGPVFARKTAPRRKAAGAR